MDKLSMVMSASLDLELPILAAWSSPQMNAPQLLEMRGDFLWQWAEIDAISAVTPKLLSRG
ncbi:MAG: hypothetical protein EBZ76_01580 [Synechococcaceae bacterium WB9_2_170]|nr:hypothetical protein [Synechococcaceae bacterium WB9_2_170]